jgi:hypothetical protein
MPRLSLAAAALGLCLAPALSFAQEPPVLVSPGEAKPIRFFSPDNPIVVGPAQTVWPASPPHKFGHLLTARLLADNHECAPDGCPKPIGCGNHWTELKWIFGSCRQFFGTASAAVGEGRATFVPQ